MMVRIEFCSILKSYIHYFSRILMYTTSDFCSKVWIFTHFSYHFSYHFSGKKGARRSIILLLNR